MNGYSRSFSRPTLASSSARGPGSDLRCRRGLSSCTAAASGSRASLARGARSRSRFRRVELMAAARILIAEDNGKSMKLFRDVLEASGYETLEATTGEQAIELAIQHGADLV